MKNTANNFNWKIFIVLLSLLKTFSVEAQTSTADSLLQVISQSDGSIKTDAFIQLNTLSQTSDPKQALIYSRKAMLEASSDLEKLLALDGLLYGFERLRIYDSVDANIEEALALSYAINDSIRIAQYLSTRGWKYYYQGEFNKATLDFKDSYKVYTQLSTSPNHKEDLDHSRLAMLTNNLGTGYTKLGQYDSAIYYFVISLNYKEKFNASETTITASLINLSGLYLYKDDHKNGIKYAERAFELAKKNSDSLNMTRTLINLGIAHKHLGNTSEAIANYKQALILSREIKYNKTISSSLTNLGTIYTDTKEWDKAGKYLKESLLFNETFKNKSSYCNVLSNLANYYFEVQKYDSAVYYSLKSLELSTEIGEIQISQNNYKIASKSAAKLNDFENAYTYSLLHKQVYDSIFNLESTERYDNLQTKYETAEKEKEIIVLKYDNEVQKSQKQKLWWGIGAIITVFLFIAFFFFEKRKKDKEIHHQQKLVLLKDKELSEAELEKSKLIEQELKNEILYKSKQLTTHALNMMQKNTLMHELQEELTDLSSKAKDENKPAFRHLKMMIRKNLRSEKDWDLFKLYFEDVNKKFYEELALINPDLTSNDLKLCALLKLNMNIKESASVMNIEPASVKTARYKLRKKLNLKPADELQEFIRKIG